MKKPKISVILPAYNVEKYIKSAVKSVLSQSFSDFELIIVNDCSTDDTPKILDELKKIDGRIVVINNKKNMGIVRSLNLAIEASRGNYIARMDGDDLSMPHRLSKQYAVMEASKVDLIAGSYELIDEENKILNTHYVSVNPADILPLMHVSNPFVHGSVMMRSSFIFEKKLLYDASHQFVEDYDLWVKMVLAGAKVALLPDIIYRWRFNSQGISARNIDAQEKLRNDVVASLWRLDMLPAFSPGTVKLSKNLNGAHYSSAPAISANNYLLESYSRLCIELFRRNKVTKGIKLFISLLIASPHAIKILPIQLLLAFRPKKIINSSSHKAS